MRFINNVWLAAIASLFLAACASTTFAPPFYDEPSSGVTFWTISPLQDRHIYSFHWAGDLLSVARSGDDGLVYYDVPVSTCPLLGAMLIQFRESILDSVEIVFYRQPAVPPEPPGSLHEIVVDGPLYRARYVPDRFRSSVQLEGGESKKVPWISAAKAVKARETTCTDS